jgi:YD repeat-containing protein
MRATAINHVSIGAPDLEASVRFYTEVFGMERVAAPTFPGLRVAWLQLGDQQLHLFERAVTAPQFHHLGLDVDDFEAVYLKLRELGIADNVTFSEGVLELPGGEAQMYMRDPAGNLVEIDWPDASTLGRNIVADMVRLADVVPQGPEARGARLYQGRIARSHGARD